METLSFTCTNMLAPNPSAKRAQRVKWSMKPSKDENEQIIAYGSGKNVVFRNLKEPGKSMIYNKQILNNVTCVKYNHTGYYVAFGDEKGNVKVIGWSQAENGFVVKYEKDGLLAGGAVNDIAFSEDNQKIAVVGAGARAKAINIESNSGAGELTGHTATVLSVDIKTSKPYKCVLTGEDKEVQTYKGPPFKLDKSI